MGSDGARIQLVRFGEGEFFMTELPNKTPTAVKTLTLNFAPDLTEGVTIGSQQFTKTLVRSDPGSLVGTGVGIATPPAVPDVGAATLTITASEVVDQRLLVLVGGGLDGNHYQIIGEVACSDGQTIDNIVRFAVYDLAA
jgi:hypothetical protein